MGSAISAGRPVAVGFVARLLGFNRVAACAATAALNACLDSWAVLAWLDGLEPVAATPTASAPE